MIGGVVMRILQINAVNKNGSTGRNVYELHKAMLNRGIQSYVAATHMRDNEENCFQIGTKLDWKLHGLFSRFFGLQGYFSKLATKELLDSIKRIKPDVVHLNNAHANYLNLRQLFNFLSVNDIPTVITLHDCWFYTGKCTHYTSVACNKWKTRCHHCPQLKKDNVSWFFDRTSKMWNDKKNWYESIPRLAVVGVSNWITEEAKKSILKNAKIIERIYNWVNLDVFKPVETKKIREKLNIFDKKVILGVASEWDNRKGLERFVELSKVISKKEYVIILVGNCKQTELPSNIITVNLVNDVNELVQYYSLADVFVQMSLQESFGKVVAESLACGTPVVTIDSTANSELVSRNCGIVINSMEISQIAKAIETVMAKDKSVYINKCRQFAKAMFDKEKNINLYFDLYKQIISISIERDII